MTSDKQALLSEFERFLPGSSQAETGPEVGLAQVFAELAALRAEVRAETRKFGQTLEEYRRLLELVEREQADHAARLKTLERELWRPVLLDLVELRDLKAERIEAVAGLRPNWLTRLLSKRKRLKFQAVLDGLKLSLARLNQQFASLGAEAIEAQGRPFDPATMRVAEVVCLRRQPEGRVVAVLRSGWRWRGEVLRLAEVRVNKHA